MKGPASKHIASTAVAAVFLMLRSASADTTISTFDNFVSDALYPSWSLSGVVSTPSNYVVTAAGYGANYKYIGGINASGNTNIELNVNLSAANPTLADGKLGPIVDLIDGDGTRFSYRWYGQPLGNNLVLTGNLFQAIGSPGFTIVTTAVGSDFVLSLNNLVHMHMSLDPSTYSAPNQYTIAWNDLKLTTGAGPAPTGICAVVSTFDNVSLAGTYGSWSTQTPGPTALTVSGTGYGGGWRAVNNVISTDSNKTVRVNLDLSTAGSGQVLVVLEDDNSTQMRYTWGGQTAGTGKTLSMPLKNGVLAQGGSDGVFNYSAISFFHIQIDIAAAYTATWNDLSIIGCEGGGGGGGICGVVSAFDNVTLSGTYGNWITQTPTPTNLQITATGYGGGYGYVPSALNVASNKTLQLNVSLSATDPVGASGKLGPLVVLQDGDGTQMQFTWYGQSTGANQLFSKPLTNGTIVLAGSVLGFDYSSISAYHVQLDPSSYGGSYTVAWNDLSIIGCDGGNPPTTQVCTNLASFDYFSFADFGGFYGNWGISGEVSTPTNTQVTCSGGFGGGYTELIDGYVAALTNNSIQLDVDLTAGPTAAGKLGPLVVLEDSDGTQLRYAWYGNNPGTNLVFSRPLYLGTVAQAGTNAGFNYNEIRFFHVQLDPSTYSGSYTMSCNDLSIVGTNCASANAPVQIQITSASYNAATKVFALTWTSETTASYNVETTTSLPGGWGAIATGVPSQGTTTTVSFLLTDPQKTFVRVVKP